MAYKRLVQEIQDCRLCEAHCSDGCRPLFQAHPQARILIIGQAPGRRAHASGMPWNDPSGKRLREWMDVTDETFYNPRQVALMPMGFCYPGTGKGGDLPPRPECAPTWHPALLKMLKHVSCTLLIGQYALKAYASELSGQTLTEQVRHYQDIAPERFPLPHPSPRNQRWFKANPWFTKKMLPRLRARVAEALA